MLLPSPTTDTLPALEYAWREHRLWLNAMLQQPQRLLGLYLREDVRDSSAYRRLSLRLLADQTALGYDALDLMQCYETAWQAFSGGRGALWWRWQRHQHQRQQRVLLLLTRALLQQCQLKLASQGA